MLRKTFVRRRSAHSTPVSTSMHEIANSGRGRYIRFIREFRDGIWRLQTICASTLGLRFRGSSAVPPVAARAWFGRENNCFACPGHTVAQGC